MASAGLPPLRPQEGAAGGRDEDDEAIPRDNYDELVSALPSYKGMGGHPYRKYRNFYYPEHLLPAALAIHHSFKPRPTDIILATIPKSGTTWLKGIIFSTVHRARHAPSDPHHPVLTSSPHDLLPFLADAITNPSITEGVLACEAMPPPRLLAMHLPFSLLPASTAESRCKIIYLCRDPKDAFVSLRHFLNQFRSVPEGRYTASTSFAEDFELLCQGVSGFGPMWDHSLEYWREAQKRPAEVLFLKYEDVKKDSAGHVRKLAEFLGRPFSKEEEAEGAAEEIARLCSFERMRSVEANRRGERVGGIFRVSNSAFFRKGEVGDWKEHMTAEMAERLDRIVEEKLQGSGLTFRG